MKITKGKQRAAAIIASLMTVLLVFSVLPTTHASAATCKQDFYFVDLTNCTPHKNDIDIMMTYTSTKMPIMDFATTNNPNARYMSKPYRGSSLFRPTKKVTRIETVTYLYMLAQRYRVVGSTQNYGYGFKDVPNDSTVFSAAVKWAKRYGITTGYSDGTFRPNSPVQRQDMAAFFYRFYTKMVPKSKQKKTIRAASLSNYTDVKSSTPHRSDIAWMVGAGISTGYNQSGGKKRFGVGQNTIKQDMAAFLNRTGNLIK